MGRRKGGPREQPQRVRHKGKAKGNDSYLSDNAAHFNSFKAQLAPYGLQLRDITGDGNCLFRALGDQLEGHSENHRHIRAEIVDFMAANTVDFEPFSEDDIPFSRHLAKLRNCGTYGGQECIVAFARLHNLNVVVHQLNAPVYKIEGSPNATRDIHLAYHNYEHYSSVRVINDSSRTPTQLQLTCMPNGPSTSTCKDADVVATELQSDSQPNCSQNEEIRENPEISGQNEAKITPEVLEVMEKSGCQDENLAIRSLEDHQFNVDLTVDFITSLMLATADVVQPEIVEVEKNDVEVDNNIKTNSDPIEIPTEAEAKIDSHPKPKQKKPHLTKRDKKELRRREKAQKHKTTPTSVEIANSLGADSLITQLNCLRV